MPYRVLYIMRKNIIIDFKNIIVGIISIFIEIRL